MNGKGPKKQKCALCASLWSSREIFAKGIKRDEVDNRMQENSIGLRGPGLNKDHQW